MPEYPIAPMPAPRMTRADAWKRRPCVVAYWAYKDRLRELGASLPIPARIIFYVAMPDSWSKKKKLTMNGQPHTQKPDLDNYIKGLFDSLLESDAHIWAFYAEKRWRTAPGIAIEPI